MPVFLFSRIYLTLHIIPRRIHTKEKCSRKNLHAPFINNNISGTLNDSVARSYVILLDTEKWWKKRRIIYRHLRRCFRSEYNWYVHALLFIALAMMLHSQLGVLTKTICFMHWVSINQRSSNNRFPWGLLSETGITRPVFNIRYICI